MKSTNWKTRRSERGELTGLGDVTHQQGATDQSEETDRLDVMVIATRVITIRAMRSLVAGNDVRVIMVRSLDLRIFITIVEMRRIWDGIVEDMVGVMVFKGGVDAMRWWRMMMMIIEMYGECGTCFDVSAVIFSLLVVWIFMLFGPSSLLCETRSLFSSKSMQ